MLGHPLSYPDNRWVCPITGVGVYKDIERNLEQRERLCRQMDSSREAASKMLAACSRSFLLWCNLFAWTYVIMESDEHGRSIRSGSPHVPFITWPCQDAAHRRMAQIRTAGGSRSVGLEKSRDMGATWICLAWCVHDCIFPGSGAPANWLIVSRKMEEVWLPGDQKALFSKIEYLIERLPESMRPSYLRREMHLSFPKRGTVIAGESTNQDVGRGDRRTTIFIDEAAAIDNLRSIDYSTNDTTPFRIFNSTNKPGSYFTSILLPSGRLTVVNLAWWDHPQKGKDRKEVIDPITGVAKFTSPWYEAECANRDAKDVAENLDMDRQGAGSLVFDSGVIQRQKAQYASQLSFRRGNVRLPVGLRIDLDASPTTWPINSAEWAEDERGGCWRWFVELNHDEMGRLRPDQRHDYGLGVDVCYGKGASLSVLSLIDFDTGWKVARWSSSHLPPEELAEVILLAGYWIGGRSKCPLVVVEANGPGDNTLVRLKRLGYGRIYAHEDVVRRAARQTLKLGWHSSRVEKARLLEAYRSSMARNLFKNMDAESLEQCLQYVHYENGGIGLATEAEETEDARRAHGDLVIGDALANLALARAPLMQIEPHQPPWGSPGYRLKRRQEKEARRRGERV